VILVDTSIWIDHLRTGDPELGELLRDGQVLAHPWVTGELALGHLSRRSEILGLIHNLPQATVATDGEVLTLIDKRQLFGLGIGYVDAHLLAATALTPRSHGAGHHCAQLPEELWVLSSASDFGDRLSTRATVVLPDRRRRHFPPNARTCRIQDVQRHS
jgi:predicted nucleic acid-binding protein